MKKFFILFCVVMVLFFTATPTATADPIIVVATPPSSSVTGAGVPTDTPKEMPSDTPPSDTPPSDTPPSDTPPSDSAVTLGKNGAGGNRSQSAIEKIKLLAPLTGTSEKEIKSEDIGNYVTSVYKLLVGLAGVLAVIYIVYGGFELVVSGVSPGIRNAAKERIKDAVIGLLLVVSSVTIAGTIDSRFVNFNLNLEKVKEPLSPTVGVGISGGRGDNSTTVKGDKDLNNKIKKQVGVPDEQINSLKTELISSLNGACDKVINGSECFSVSSGDRGSGEHINGNAADLKNYDKLLAFFKDKNNAVPEYTSGTSSGFGNCKHSCVAYEFMGVLYVVEPDSDGTGNHLHAQLKNTMKGNIFKIKKLN